MILSEEVAYEFEKSNETTNFGQGLDQLVRVAGVDVYFRVEVHYVVDACVYLKWISC